MKEWEIVFFVKHYPNLTKEYFIELVRNHYESNGEKIPKNVVECYQKYIEATTMQNA